jgi:hypothetical protein
MYYSYTMSISMKKVKFKNIESKSKIIIKTSTLFDLKSTLILRVV